MLQLRSRNLAVTARTSLACKPHQRVFAHKHKINRAHNVEAKSGIDLDALGLDMPEIDGDIKTYQQSLGAVFDADDKIATSFNNSAQVFEALTKGAVVVDLSHWGRVRLAGGGRSNFLHNQSTNDFKQLTPGQGCDTVFVTATGRCLDLCRVLVGPSSALVITSPGMAQTLAARFDSYIFPADDVKVADVSSRCSQLALMGPESAKILTKLGGDAVTVTQSPEASHQLLQFRRGAPVMVSVGGGLPCDGFTLIADESVAGDLYGALVDEGCVPMGSDDWEVARVLAGRPAVGAELTDQVNPLETGLYHCVSLNKGCYIGQETLSKVHHQGGLKQQLWGLRMTKPAAPGDPISAGGEVVGRVSSSCITCEGDHVGLGFVRCRRQGVLVNLEGVTVEINGGSARLVAPAYLTRGFEGSRGGKDPSPPPSDDIAERTAAAKKAKQESKSAADLEREERIKAMEARLAAFQAQQAAAKKQQQQ